MNLLQLMLTIVHVMASAIWLGAMVYSFFVLHPRGLKYFARLTDFDSFIATLSQGARWKVVLAMAAVALSGVGLVAISMGETDSLSWILIGIKIVLLVACAAVFWHVSWRLWPARSFATEAEIPYYLHLFRRSAAILIALVGLGMILGMLARSHRTDAPARPGSPNPVDRQAVSLYDSEDKDR